MVWREGLAAVDFGRQAAAVSADGPTGRLDESHGEDLESLLEDVLYHPFWYGWLDANLVFKARRVAFMYSRRANLFD